MNRLLTTLREQFPLENTCFGKCLVIPARLFKPEWQKQLENLGLSTFMQSWNGESCVFVQLEKPKPNTKFGKHWSPEEVEQLKSLVRLGLSPSEIASKLGRTRIAVRGKIRRLGLHMEATPQTDTNQTSLEDDFVKEFLGACSLLYPTYKKACAFLLKECVNKILGEKT